MKYRDIEDKRKKLESVMDKCEVMAFTDLVSWRSVQEWKVGESKAICNSINKLILKEKNIMIFETMIPPGVTFINHWHDFREHNFIISGLYRDASSEYRNGTWAHYKPYQKHEVHNPSEDEELKIVVIFTMENENNA